MGIFKTFRGDEIQLTPYNAHKDYIVYIENYTGSYYEDYYDYHDYYEIFILLLSLLSLLS